MKNYVRARVLPLIGPSEFPVWKHINEPNQNKAQKFAERYKVIVFLEMILEI